MKPGIKQALKTGFSLALLAFTLSLIDWRNCHDLARRAAPAWLLAAVGLLLAERLLSVAKWLLLLRARGSAVTFWRLLVINYVGGFWGLVLPSSVSADIARGYYLSRHTANVSLAVTSMLVDRLLGVVSLVGLGCISAWLVGDTFGLPHARVVASLVLLACAAGAALLFHDRSMRGLDRLFIRRLAHGKRLEPVRRWIGSCFEYRRSPRVMVSALLLTVIVQMVRVLVFYAVAVGFGVRAPVTYYFIFIPLIMLLIMLPVSINGIGVREGSFVAFFALVNVPAAEAFVVSFAVSVLTTLMTAVGGLFYILDKGAPPAAVPPPAREEAKRPCGRPV